MLYSEALKNSPRSTKADSDQNNSIDLSLLPKPHRQ
nr:MAG TPA: hypothetical protein [Caudoviricetes sp.]